MIQSDPLFVNLNFNYLIFNNLNFLSDPTDTHTLCGSLVCVLSALTVSKSRPQQLSLGRVIY